MYYLILGIKGNYGKIFKTKEELYSHGKLKKWYDQEEIKYIFLKKNLNN